MRKITPLLLELSSAISDRMLMHVTTDFPAILPNLHCVLLTHHFLFPVTKVNKKGRGKFFNNCDGVCSLLKSFLTPFYTPSWREAKCEV